LPKHYARVGSLPRSGDFRLYAEITMADPDEKRLDEEELELLQQSRLLDVFSQLDTYDARESVIKFCEKLISSNRKC
jgi:hypothetical protein